MKMLREIALVSGCLIALTGCNGFNKHSEVDALNEAKSVGNPFTQHLTQEYRDLTNHELNKMMDYPDALHFARKGIASAAGEVVMPEPIEDWNLLPKHIVELGTARGRLIIAFDLGAREIAPAQAARTQALFDCWIEQQEEHWNAPDQDLYCKTRFLSAMNELEGLIPAAPVMEMPAETYDLPETAEPMTPEEAMYLVFFDFDSSAIGAGGHSVLDAVAEAAATQGAAVVHVEGHTDSSGPQKYNDRLSMKRANAVRDALVARGISASSIEVKSYGESNLLVKTLDNIREPANRRAQITFD